MIPRPASADTTSTLLTAAAAIGAIVLYNNYERKQAAANTVVGYTRNGGTVYADGRIVMPDGQTYYPNSNGQNAINQYGYNNGYNPYNYGYGTAPSQYYGRYNNRYNGQYNYNPQYNYNAQPNYNVQRNANYNSNAGRYDGNRANATRWQNQQHDRDRHDNDDKRHHG
jgi:hypothetical protein